MTTKTTEAWCVYAGDVPHLYTIAETFDKCVDRLIEGNTGIDVVYVLKNDYRVAKVEVKVIE